MARTNKTGYVGVYKNSDGNLYRYESYLTLDPKKKRVSKGGFLTAEAANEAKIAYEDRVYYLIKVKKIRLNLGYIAESFLNWIRPNNKITTYHHKMLLIEQYILKKYSSFSVSKFTSNTFVNQFREEIINKNISIEQKNKVFHVVTQMFNYAVLSSLVKSQDLNNVFLKMTKLKDTSIRQDKNNTYWSKEEFQKFISLIPKEDKWYTFFTLFFSIGCRMGEMRGLQNKHVDLEEGSIRIEQQCLNNIGNKSFMLSTPKTKSSVRTVYISPKMCETLKEYFRSNINNDPECFLFFNSYKPVGVSTIRRCFDKYTKIAKLRHIKIHGIRHTYTTWLLSDNLNPQDIGYVSKQLGHASVRETLDTYLYIHNKKNKKVMNNLNTIF